MFERNVYDEYKLYCEQRFFLGDYEGFTAHNKHYFLVGIDEIEDQEIREMINMGNHLLASGDHEIATFIPTKQNALTSFVDGENCVLLQLPQFVSRSKKSKRLGYELARFHVRGKTYQTSSQSKDSWSQFWIKRLSQLEMLYVDLSKQGKKSSFDQAFMISFPYYLGRTETAIQYFVDSNHDLGQQLKYEERTICHYQFTNRTWLAIDDQTAAILKNPIDFTYDYPSRDIAEWMRDVMKEQNQPYPVIKEFIRDYETVQPLSPLAWRYVYSRLLFPIDYFKIVEGYYRSVDDEDAYMYSEQLYDLLAFERSMELLLIDFHQKLIPQHLHGAVPTVDWLLQKKLQGEDMFFKRRY